MWPVWGRTMIYGLRGRHLYHWSTSPLVLIFTAACIKWYVAYVKRCPVHLVVMVLMANWFHSIKLPIPSHYKSLFTRIKDFQLSEIVFISPKRYLLSIMQIYCILIKIPFCVHVQIKIYNKIRQKYQFCKIYSKKIHVVFCIIKQQFEGD
jgi:hypothetical protein